MNTKFTLLEGLKNAIDHRDTEHYDIIALTNDAAAIDSIIAQKEYENILVLPTPIPQSDRLRSRFYRAHNNYGDQLFPIIHEINESAGNVYVGLPESGHLYEKAWKDFGVKILPMDNWFSLNRKIDLKTDIKFDAVVLLGNTAFCKSGTFKSTDIKKNLSSVCTEDFDLIDIDRGNTDRNIKGNTQDISLEVVRYMHCVNTPHKHFRIEGNINKDMRSDVGKTKALFVYWGVSKNIGTLKDFYKVYK
jgi:hypothetical protein